MAKKQYNNGIGRLADVEPEMTGEPVVTYEREPIPEIPTEAIPEITTEEKAEAIPEFVACPADTVALRVYITLCGHKWDQMAGFVSHARRQNLAAISVEAWHAEYKKFQGKPIG